MNHLTTERTEYVTRMGCSNGLPPRHELLLYAIAIPAFSAIPALWRPDSCKKVTISLASRASERPYVRRPHRNLEEASWRLGGRSSEGPTCTCRRAFCRCRLELCRIRVDERERPGIDLWFAGVLVDDEAIPTTAAAGSLHAGAGRLLGGPATSAPDRLRTGRARGGGPDPVRASADDQRGPIRQPCPY